MQTRLYGLTIDLNLDIDGLPVLSSAGSSDLRIEVGASPAAIANANSSCEGLWYVGPHFDVEGQPELRIFRLADGGLLTCYSDGVSFRIDRQLDLIQCWWQPPRELGDALGYLFGPVLGLLLRLRNRVCMHASGVVIDGRAQLLVGHEGAGKSTTIAALVQLGHHFLTDDIAPLEEAAEGIVVHPGVPRIFLEPGSIRALAVRPQQLQRQSPTWDKCFLGCLPSDPRWSQTVLPLQSLYVLDRDDSRQMPPRCQALNGYAALAAVVAHTYASRTLDTQLRADEFRFVARLLERVRVVQVQFSRGFDHLPDLCRLIETDAGCAEASCTASPITAT